LFKSFIAGIFLGIVACVAALYLVPAVDQERELSINTVSPNGGKVESFHVNVPMDRIMSGRPQQAAPLPAGLKWPSDEKFSNIRAELFKIRNSKDAVVGVASRVAVDGGNAADIIEWVLHLPARGSVYVSMRPDAMDSGYRIGELRSGTREFGLMHGQVTERWVNDTSGSEGAPAGQIQLQTKFVAAQREY